MIKSISIENFKSIQSLELELSRVNVFIGANGCGKSNILEAIAMASAAMEEKLDNEFLFSRGIRIVESEFMKSRFSKANIKKPIKVKWSNDTSGNDSWDLNINSPTHRFGEWTVSGSISNEIRTIRKITAEEWTENIYKAGKELNDENLRSIYESIKNLLDGEDSEDFKNILIPVLRNQLINTVYEKSRVDEFLDFLIYAPENYFLRRFEEESQIRPLGIKGEGLFSLLSYIQKNNPKAYKKIKTNLELIDWFDDFEIPKDLAFTEKRIKIKDHYLNNGLSYFDQRSANEGFLFLLFYLTLFISKQTPSFFAIDNIDNALNPKLGSKLMKTLSKLAGTHKKQVLLTTHNPVILDGLDLGSKSQSLFVVYRTDEGHTKVRKVEKPKKVNGTEPVRLSEAFIRGYIGGLPKNF